LNCRFWRVVKWPKPPVGGRAAFGDVVLAGDAGQLAQLAAAQLAVGHGHAQHRRMALHVPAVLQAQRAELVVPQFAAQVALELVAELGGALRTNWRSKSV
jgi:cobalamin biosynthesis protein CbiD